MEQNAEKNPEKNPEKKQKTSGSGDFRIRQLPWKRIWITAGLGILTAILLILGFVWYLLATTPDIDSITVSPMESATYICDADGSYLRKLTLAASNRDIVSLEEIPEDLQHAIVAIEDERFYEHGGIDLRGIMRAFVTGVTHGSFSEGASTITQQLIKNSVFTEWTQENSFADRFSRKVQEQYLALQLEDRMGKDEILENYLNTINLGSGCYGVQAASRRYFGKDVSGLTLSESAVLAAIPQNPTANNPISHPETNQKRAATVLQYMQEQGYISQEELQTALADDVYARIREYDDSYEEETAYTYYEDALIDQVMDVLCEEKGWSSEQAYRAVYSGGLRIFSAQDETLQQICDEEFLNPDNYPAGTQYGVDYALSIADSDGLVTHYGTEALRTYVRQTINSGFNLLCDTEEEAQSYADAFREYILAEHNADSGTSEPVSEADSNTLPSETAEDPVTSTETAVRRKNQNSTSQQETENASYVLAERLTLAPQPQASLVLIDQYTGFVRAIVGGRGEKTASLTLNRATETTRQPGSTFKILTAYAPALDAFGQTLATEYENEPYRYENGTAVSNWDVNDYSGTVTIREAITRSINVVAVRCITEITPRTGFEYAQRFGITTLHESYESDGSISSDVIQPLALGGITQGVTNLELCGSYAAIANGGFAFRPKFFTKILDRHGNVILDYTESSSSGSELTQNINTATAGETLSFDSFTRILKEDTAFLLTNAMQDVVSDPSGTAYGSISAAGHPVAGKTGTTSNYKDIWFVGYTPYYTCCVWGGYDNNENLPDGAHSYSKTLWSAVMNRIHSSLPIQQFTQPDTVTAVTLCSESHLPAVADACPKTYTEYFTRGTEPADECPLHEPIPETQPILIYQDLLDQLHSESETETESGTKLPGQSESTTEQLEPGSGVLPNESEPGVGILPNESEPGIGELPEESESGVGGLPEESESGVGGLPEESGSGVGIFPGESGSGASIFPGESGSGGSGSSGESGLGGSGLNAQSASGNSLAGESDAAQTQPDTSSFEDLLSRLPVPDALP